MFGLNLEVTKTPGGEVTPLEGEGWRLSLEAGGRGYRLAELDDYRGLRRREFPWQPPLTFSLQARASGRDLPGTWGFGLWNDPFGLSIGFGGGQKLPTLPNAAWFFFASPQNHLSLRDDLPASGALAAVFRAAAVPWPLLALGIPAAPLLVLRPFVRLVRRLGRRMVKEDSVRLGHDPTSWHRYELTWQEEGAALSLDGTVVLESGVAPSGPLGLVIWIDNQYAALTPEGKLGWGTLPNPDGWIEIKELDIHQR